MAYYLDTSALVKLFVAEDHSAAARRWFRSNRETAFSCDLPRTEALRVARRISPRATRAVRQLLDGLPLLAMDAELCERAGMLDPGILRSLDALHLAAALSFGEELDGVVTYDDRFGEAASAYGVEVICPR